MGSFKMAVHRPQRVFGVKVEGTFSQEDALAFINDYNKETSAIAAADYSIELDCTELNVSSPDVLPMLEQCYRMYQQTGFKHVVFKIARNPVLRMQLGRVARNTGLTNYEITEV